jgi:putative heme iron utilization protein
MAKHTDALAKSVHKELKGNPELTVPELATRLEVEESEIVQVLDSYLVTDGKLEHAGEGKGGGWVEETG